MRVGEMATDEHVQEGHLFIGCVNHPHVDARSGGTVFPVAKKAQPYWACRECAAEAIRQGLSVHRYGEPYGPPPATTAASS